MRKKKKVNERLGRGAYLESSKDTSFTMVADACSEACFQSSVWTRGPKVHSGDKIRRHFGNLMDTAIG